MSNIHITGELPAQASSDEGKAAMAMAISTALTTASADPEFRLRMILGEAYQKYTDLLMWLDTEIQRDEAKAPGLGQLAERFAGDTELLLKGTKPSALDALRVQRNLLDDLMRERRVPEQPPVLPADTGTIEHVQV